MFSLSLSLSVHRVFRTDALEKRVRLSRSRLGTRMSARVDFKHLTLHGFFLQLRKIEEVNVHVIGKLLP